jgi:hypothetical protein
MTDFEHWWYHEGSQGPNGMDLEEHCKRMCQIAWSNGAFKAKGWSEPLDRLLDEAKLLADDRPVEVGNLPGWSLDAEHMIRRLVKAFNSAPQPAQQEPVTWGVDWGRAGQAPCATIIKRLHDGWIEVLAVEYGPERTWRGLTDEERQFVRNSVRYNQFMTAGEYAEHVQKATEAMLKERNK